MDSRLTNAMLDYVKHEYLNHFAMMLNGEWGSGKTYFVQNILKEKIEKETGKKMLYVSLNGVSSYSEIFEQILSEKWKLIGFFKENKVARIGLKVIKSTGNVLFRALKFNTSGGEIDPNSADLPTVSAKELIDFSKNVVVFDDLERISPKIKHSDILGFINSNFVEHDKIKTIILCDESKILDVELQDSKKYVSIKEKVIGRTLTYSPNIECIINEYIDGLKENDPKYYNFLNLQRDFLSLIITNADIKNLRTVFFFFDSLKEIIKDINVDFLETLAKEIIHTTLVFSNEYKLGYLQQYSSSKELPLYFSDSHISFSILNESLNDWVNSDKVHNYKNNDENKVRDIMTIYGMTNQLHYKFIPSVFEYIKFGLLNIENLETDLKRHIPTTNTEEQKYLERLSKNNLFKISNNECFYFISELCSAVNIGKLSLSELMNIFVRIKGILLQEITTEKELKTNIQYLENGIEEFFISKIDIAKKRLDDDLEYLIEKSSIIIEDTNNPINKVLVEKFHSIYEEIQKNESLEFELEGFEKLKRELKIDLGYHGSLERYIAIFPEKVLELIFESFEQIGEERANQIISMFRTYKWFRGLTIEPHEIIKGLKKIEAEFELFVKDFPTIGVPIQNLYVKTYREILGKAINEGNMVMGRIGARYQIH